MRLSALLPFAALGVLIVVVSSAAVFSSMQSGISGPIAEPSPTVTAGATPRAVPELSKSGRLAYWREGRLWVSGLDGSLRRTLAPVDDPRRLSSLRWSPDGNKIAYLDGGHSLVVVRVDGQRWDIALPLVLRDQGWRIADIRWAPDSTRIAATFLRPGDGRADIFLTDISPALPTWSRATAMNDAFAGDWVTNSELLASTAGGVIAVLEVPPAPPGVRFEDVVARDLRVRPLSGALGTSPILAGDGRIHFLAGRVPNARDPSLPYITASRASIWSATLDGSDVRRETLTELNDVRLDARLPDGRYLVHRGSADVQSITGDEIEALPVNGGVIQRLRLAPDGRTAYGFTLERIVQLDISKVGLPPPAAEPTATVFLDTGGEADVWFPAPTASITRGGGEPLATQPTASYAFVLGGHLWRMGPDGRASLLRAGQTIRRTLLPTPRWSPSGKELLALEQAGFGAPTTALIAVTIDADGEQTRLADTYASARSFSWSPDGSELAVVVDRRGVNGTASDAVLEVRFMDASGKATRPAMPGSQVAWTSRGLLVVTEASGTDLQLQLIPESGPARSLITRSRLMLDPRIGTSLSGFSWINLSATPDGSYASGLLEAVRSGDSSFILFDSAGQPIEFLPGSLADATWSPAKPLIGYTLDPRTAVERAVVHQPGGEPLVTQDGRFAGWSPDGEWYYVARITGLFAYSLAGGLGVRVAPVGVPVAATVPN